MAVESTEEEIESTSCNWEELELVPCYEYLETIIEHNGRMHQEITNRTKKAVNTYYQLSQIIFDKKEISPNIKTQVNKTIIESFLIYGGEAGQLGRKDKLKYEE